MEFNKTLSGNKTDQTQSNIIHLIAGRNDSEHMQIINHFTKERILYHAYQKKTVKEDFREKLHTYV
jgi:hypothetical protein